MSAELNDFCFHCQKCNLTQERKPNSCWISNSHVFSEIAWAEKKPKVALNILHGCRSLFFFYQNIIDIGPDSFVLVSSRENPTSVLKIYTNSNIETIINYQKQTQLFAESNNGKVIQKNGQKFTLLINPISEIVQLGHSGCIATLSPFVSGKNEYDDLRDTYREYSKKHKGLLDGIQFETFEKDVSKAVGKYIDPRNFKVDLENRKITITDIGCNISNEY